MSGNFPSAPRGWRQEWLSTADAKVPDTDPPEIGVRHPTGSRQPVALSFSVTARSGVLPDTFCSASSRHQASRDSAKRERSLAERERSLAEQERSLAEQERSLAERPPRRCLATSRPRHAAGDRKDVPTRTRRCLTPIPPRSVSGTPPDRGNRSCCRSASRRDPACCQTPSAAHRRATKLRRIRRSALLSPERHQVERPPRRCLATSRPRHAAGDRKDAPTRTRRCLTPVPPRSVSGAPPSFAGFGEARYFVPNAVCSTPESKPEPAVPVVAKRYSAAE